MKIKFHSCVLASQAGDRPVIAAMLLSDFKEKNLKMAYTQYTSETVEELLKFLYVRQINTVNNSEKIKILYVAANYCGIEKTNDTYPSHSNLATAILCENSLWAMWSSYGFWEGPLYLVYSFTRVYNGKTRLQQ